jgi:uncharacterized RDD family membrane protein YckC
MRLRDVKRIAAGSALALVAATSPLTAQSEMPGGLRANIALTRYAPQSAPFLEISQDDVRDGWDRHVLRIGQDYALAQGEIIHEAVVVFSPVVIEGRVRGDLTVVFGTVRIAPTAVIDGSLVAIGGNVDIESGARINRDLVVVGGGLEAPAEFAPGGQHFAVGAKPIADRLRAAIPWITEGLLLGRPIVPRLGWVWFIVGFVFLASLALSLLFLNTVRTCADAIARRPLTAFLTGLLVLLLVGPVSIILAASVIGLAVVPFVLIAVVVAWIIGKVGVSVWIGDAMVGQAPPAGRFQTARSFALGFAAVCLLYMVPVLGFIAWAIVGVTGLGAASLAFMSAYRRENPAKAKPAPPPPPAPVDPPPFEPSSFEPSPVAPPLAYAALDDADSPPLASAVPAYAHAAAVGGINLLAFTKAGFFERAAAFTLDTVFVLIIGGTFDLFEDSPQSLILALLAYHIGFWAWKQTTFGGIVCQLRIIRLDGTPLRFVDALVRGIAGMFSLAVVGLGALWILRDEDRQAWHDKIAGTYVVNVPKNWPLP